MIERMGGEEEGRLAVTVRVVGGGGGMYMEATSQSVERARGGEG